MNDASLHLPPLFEPVAVGGRTDPFDRARALAVAGADPGIVVHNITNECLRAAIVFAPEVTLEPAMAMMPACGIGFQNALGSLAPPEVAVHLQWDGAIRVNGARCGRLRAAAASGDPAAVPDWLVVGLALRWQHPDDAPGADPDRTALIEEGCAEIEPTALLEAWIRHTLVWINRWADDGNAPLMAEWRGLAHDLGEQTVILGVEGLFVGVDEHFAALLRVAGETRCLAMSRLLEH
ncbi:MAG: biotin/lipoate--protein ligase family protein [Burkholderiaceae bacterium]